MYFSVFRTTKFANTARPWSRLLVPLLVLVPFVDEAGPSGVAPCAEPLPSPPCRSEGAFCVWFRAWVDEDDADADAVEVAVEVGTSVLEPPGPMPKTL